MKNHLKAMATCILVSAMATAQAQTTDASGNAVCPLNENKYAATTGSYAVTNYNPFQVTVSATGCTTQTFTQTMTSTSGKTVKLAGC